MSRILVIDDEEAVLAAVTRRLEREGYHITAANTSQEGTNMITEAEEGARVRAPRPSP